MKRYWVSYHDDALGFVAFLLLMCCPTQSGSWSRISLQNPVFLTVGLFFLWSVYVVVDAVVRHIRILALFGAGYALILVAQRYLATR